MRRWRRAKRNEIVFRRDSMRAGNSPGAMIGESLPKTRRRVLLRLSAINWALTGPPDSRRAHADRFSDLPPRESLSSKLKSSISLKQRPRPANGPSAASSVLFRPHQPCTNSFGYPDSLLFGKTGQQADDDIAERAGAINPRFREAAPSNAVSLQQFQVFESCQSPLSR